MRTMVTGLLASLLFATTVAAQTVPQESKPAPAATTEKLWKLEVSGLGGWGAASNAARVRAILDKVKGVNNLVFDTCGTGYFEAGKTVPEVADLNEALIKQRMKGFKVTTLTEVDMPKAAVVYELTISGLG